MTKFSIEVSEFDFVRAGQTFRVDPGRFNASIIAQLVMHGATQKIGDAAAGKSDAEALTAMNAVYESLASGDWGRSRGGSAEPAINRFIRDVIRVKLGPDNKAKYAAMKGDSDARAEFLMGLYEGLAEDAQKAVLGVAEDLKAEADRAKKAAAKIVATVDAI